MRYLINNLLVESKGKKRLYFGGCQHNGVAVHNHMCVWCACVCVCGVYVVYVVVCAHPVWLVSRAYLCLPLLCFAFAPSRIHYGKANKLPKEEGRKAGWQAGTQSVRTTSV